MLERRSGKPLATYAHRGHGMLDNSPEVAVYTDASEESGTTRTLAWRRIWYDRLCRESCFRCGYHSLMRPGDLTIGDWWGLKSFLPELADLRGVSCAIASTERGMELVQGASDSLDLAVTPSTNVANSAQPMLSHPPLRAGRDDFWPPLYESGFDGACRAVGVSGLKRFVKDMMKRMLLLKKDESQAFSNTDQAWKEVPTINFSKLKNHAKYPVAFAARNRNDEVRRKSSSGGMFHALASHVIDNLGGVVYGCAFDDNLRAVHIRCETMMEAERCMGSKYSQSDMGDSIRMVQTDLAEGRTVLFTGTPCQVAAVRAVCENVRGGALDC